MALSIESINPDMLGLSHEDLNYFNPVSGFSVSAEHIKYQVFKTTLKGMPNIDDVKALAAIAEKITGRITAKGFQGKYYGVIDVENLEGGSQEVRKFILEKLREWSNYNAFIFISPNPAVRTVLKLFRYFNPDINILVAGTIEKATETFLNLIQGENQSGQGTRKAEKEWEFFYEETGYKVKIRLFDSDIFIVTPTGYVNEKSVAFSTQVFEKVVEEALQPNQPYFRIQDYSETTGASMKARRIFAEWIKNHIERMPLIFFSNMNNVMKTIVLFGKLLYPGVRKIILATDNQNSLEIIKRYKEGKYTDNAAE
ncbi:MAG: hypothetical protein ABIJ16_06155, partial [Bacteroidota bacterium]